MPVLRYLSFLAPEAVPYHPNWKRDKTHPLYLDLSTSCDHEVPLSRGGKDAKPNFFTVCSRCQYAKADWLLSELKWHRLPVTEEPWDGLSGLFVKAMRVSPVENDDLRAWATLLESDAG